MVPFKLNKRERQALMHVVSHPHDATLFRRAQALLWLDRGERVVDVAERLDVSRQVVYLWIALFRRDTPADLTARLAVGPRSGRPPTVKGLIDPLIDEVIDHDPRLFD